MVVAISAPTISRKDLVTELCCKADASFHRYWRWYMYIIVVLMIYGCPGNIYPPLEELPSLIMAALSNFWKLSESIFWRLNSITAPRIFHHPTRLDERPCKNDIVYRGDLFTGLLTHLIFDLKKKKICKQPPHWNPEKLLFNLHLKNCSG